MRTLRIISLAITAFLLPISTAFSQIHIQSDTTATAIEVSNEGHMHYNQSDWPAAAECWRRATVLSPAMVDAWYNLALAYYQMEDFLETERLLENVFAIHPFHINAYELLGMALYHRGEYARAIKAFNYVLNENPSTEIRIAKSICYIADGNPKYALPELDYILHDKPGNVKACLAKSAALIDLGQHSYALRFLNRILDIDPENHSALTNRAICYFHTGKKKLANEDFQKSLSIQPTVATFLAKGKCLLASGQLNQALTVVRKTISLYPKEPAIYYLLGEIEMGMSNYKNAIESFEIAFDLDNTCMDCLILKSEAQTHVTDFEAAIQNIYNILQDNPNNQEAREMLLWVYTQMDMRNLTKKL